MVRRTLKPANVACKEVKEQVELANRTVFPGWRPRPARDVASQRERYMVAYFESREATKTWNVMIVSLKFAAYGTLNINVFCQSITCIVCE